MRRLKGGEAARAAFGPDAAAALVAQASQRIGGVSANGGGGISRVPIV
jgi:hypothetical protein